MDILSGIYFYNFHILVACGIFYVQDYFIVVSATDNFALMSGSLRTFQAHACDGEVLRIQCHPSTVISITHALYGRPSAVERCESMRTRRPSGRRKRDPDEICMSRVALTVIENLCQEQVSCRLMAHPKTFWEDPCPDEPKYAEVAYKCRPVEFKNEIVCEGGKMNLSCSDSLRILVHSAYFGSTGTPVMECSQDAKNTEECYSSYAAERVVNFCVGKRQCAFDVDSQNLGDPKCSEWVGKHLRVVYTCVPASVLKSTFLGTDDKSIADGLETTTKEMEVHTTSYPAWASNIDQRIPSYLLPAPTQSPTSDIKLEMQRDYVSSTESNSSDESDRELVGFISEWIAAEHYVAGNTDKLILYLSVTLTVGVLLFVVVILVHVFIFRSFQRKDAEKKDLPPPITDDDFFSESDFEQFEDDPLSMINSLPRKISETVPRAPVSDDPSTNQYFS